MLLTQATWAVNTIDVSLEKGQLLLTDKHGGDGSAWGKKECSACHFKSRIHSEAPVIRDIVKDVGFASCTGCHGSNGTDAIRQCAICHNDQRLPTSPAQIGAEKHDFKTTESLPLTDAACITCHQSSDMDGQFEPEIDLTKYPDKMTGMTLPYRNGVEFCLSCHNEDHQQPGFEMKPRFKRDPLVTINLSYKKLDVHGYPRGTGQRTYSGLNDGGYRYGTLVECTDCHAMHGTHNPKLIVDRTNEGMVKLTPAIRDIPILIHVNQGDYSQLCVTCHSMDEIVEQGNEDTGNGMIGVHQVGTDCRQCHVHGLAAQTGL